MKKVALYSLLFVVLILASGQSVLSGTTVDESRVDFVLVRGGTFMMGDEVGDLHERCRPVHQVTLTYDYWIGKHQVTFDEYDAFCEDTGRNIARDQGWGRGTRPVIYVNWWDAVAYCNWLSEKEGVPVAYRLLGESDEGQLLDASGNVTTDIKKVVGYRLPTEAEWEYAARGGKYSSPCLFSGSDNPDDAAWYRDNSYNDESRGRTTWPIGLKLPNALGIYDMSGNVNEWCTDRWYAYTDVPRTNPYVSSGPSRVIRGGSWSNTATEVRVSYRFGDAPTFPHNNRGFRIARTVH